MIRLNPYLLLIPFGLGTSSLLACGDKDTPAGDDTGSAVTDGGGSDGGTTNFETGCVLVDGGGGYAWINDAVSVAADGAVISLADCSGTHTETVVLSKGVTLTGHADVTLASDDDVAVTITGDGAAVDDLVIDADGTAVLVEDAASVSLTGLVIDGCGEWAIEATGATDLSVDGANISAPGDGGVRIEGGSATIADSTISDADSYGVLVTEDAAVTVSGSTISGTNQTGSNDDGAAIGVEAATLITAGNTLSDNDSYGVVAVGGAVELSGDDISGGTFGVLASEASLVASGLTVTDAYWSGIYVFSEDFAQISDTTVVGTPGVVADVSQAEWSASAYISSGLFLFAPEIAVSDVDITGYDGVGVLVASSDGGEASLARVTLTDQGNHGVYVSGIDTSAEDVVVTGTYSTTETPDELCFAVDSDVGVVVVDADLDWSGGSITDVEGYGISGIYGSTEVDGASFARNSCASVMVFEGSGRITYSDFSDSTGGSFESSVVSYLSESIYVGANSFSDSQNEVLDRSQEYVDEGVLTRYDYYEWSGSDVQIWYGGEATITQNTFVRGVNGVEVYSAEGYGYSTATLTNNSFEDYVGLTVYLAAGSTGSVTDHTVSGHGPYAVACQSGELDLTRVSVSSGGTMTQRTAVYHDDVFQYDLEVDTSGPSVLSESCDLTVDTLTVTDADATALYLYNGSWELEDVTISGAGLLEASDGVFAQSTSGGGVIYIDGMSISGVTSGRGLYLGAYSSFTATIYDLVVSNVSDDGVDLENLGTSSVTASLSKVAVTGAGGVGMRLSDISTTLSEVSVDGSTEDGVVLSGGSSSLTGSSSTSNGGYGMVCEDSVAVSSCDIAATDNSSGAFSGCDACNSDTEVR